MSVYNLDKDKIDDCHRPLKAAVPFLQRLGRRAHPLKG